MAIKEAGAISWRPGACKYIASVALPRPGQRLPYRAKHASGRQLREPQCRVESSRCCNERFRTHHWQVLGGCCTASSSGRTLQAYAPGLQRRQRVIGVSLAAAVAKSISCKDAPALPLWRRSLARSQRVAL
jgi:hypothetical protein